ncbi:MAG: hypothetical protein EU543_00950 [Promethearchaeota archaeon]|nr:MAG: hypothetical protein EU543_00950 [Candidatus Lokiarchaeota archaeon]
MARNRLLNEMLNLDKSKAMKFIIYGLIVAVIFGTIMMISRSIDYNASSWYNLVNEQNLQNYNAGVYGYTEYLKRSEEIQLIYRWMDFQDVIFINIARLGVNISLIFIAVGFLSLGVNPGLDENTRKICIILGGIILIVLMLTTFFTNISITVS